MNFGIWILGCWILEVFFEKRVQGVYIVFPDGFFVEFVWAMWGKPFQTLQGVKVTNCTRMIIMPPLSGNICTCRSSMVSSVQGWTLGC